MSSISTRKLKNGEPLIPTSRDLLINHSGDNSNSEMESTENLTNEQARTPSSSPDPRQANEDRLNHLQNEMVALKAMMQKLFEQNEERN